MKEAQSKIYQYNLDTGPALKNDFTAPIQNQIQIEEKTASKNLANKTKDNLNTDAYTISKKQAPQDLSETERNFYQIELLNKTNLDTINNNVNNNNNSNNLSILNNNNENLGDEINDKNNLSKYSKLNYSEFIEKMGFTRKANQVYLLANFLQFIWGMEACFIAINLERLATNSSVPLGTKSVLISILYAMLGIGSALMGHLTKVLGRIKLIVLSTIAYCLFVVLCSLPVIESFYVIYAFRCLANIALGIFNISILNLLTEYLPIKKRSYVLMVNSGLYNFGNIFLILINNIFLADMNKNFDFNSWRVINLLCVIPGLISLIFSIFYVEESPLYLINNEHKDENNSKKAYKILKEMSEVNKGDFNEAIFNAIKTNAHSLESFKLKSTYSELFHSSFVRLTICNIIICTICYMNMVGISYITPKTISEKGKEILQMSFDTQLLIYSIIQLPNGWIGGLMTESIFIGRKKTIYVSSLLCALFYFIINYFPYYIAIYAGIIMLFNSIGFGSAFIYVSEIYPTNLRDQAQSLIQCISFLIGAFAPFMIDYFYAQSFLLLGASCLICIVVAVFVGEETNMRPLDVELTNKSYF